MGLIYDPSEDDAIAELFRRVDALERMAPTGHSSVTTGQFRIASIDGLLVEGQERVTGILVVDGNLQVTGTESVTGTLIVSGGLILTGTFNLQGATNVSGTTTFTGDVHITGAFDLTGTMTVSGGGKIQVGNLLLEPGGTFGGQISAGGVGVLLVNAVNLIVTGFVTAQNLSLSGDAEMLGDLITHQNALVNNNLTVDNNVFMPNLPIAPPGSVANCWIDPSDGQTYRIL